MPAAMALLREIPKSHATSTDFPSRYACVPTSMSIQTDSAGLPPWAPRRTPAKTDHVHAPSASWVAVPRRSLIDRVMRAAFLRAQPPLASYGDATQGGAGRAEGFLPPRLAG